MSDIPEDWDHYDPDGHEVTGDPAYAEARTRAAERRAGQVTCDPAKGNAFSPAPHDYAHVGEEYGSLANGGSYDVLECRSCGRRAYSNLPD